MSTASPAPAPLAPPTWSEVLRHVVPVFLMGACMTLLYLSGFHRPEPHHVPIAVVTASPQAEQLAPTLSARLGAHADVRTAPSQEDADAALRRQEVAGVVAAQDGGVRLSVARAASDTTASAVTQLVQRALAPEGTRVTVRDVAPLPESDPAGQNGFFSLVVLSVSSYSMAIGLAAAAARRRLRDRLAAALAASAVITGFFLVVAVGALGMFEGHVAAVAALAWLLSATILLIGLGTHTLVGRFTTFALATTFVGLSFTSSGGVFEPVLQPHLFGWLHGFWIGSAFVQTVTRVLYFPELSATQPLAVLLAWTALGAVLVALAGVVERRRAAPQRRVEDHAAARRGEDLELEEDVAV